MTKRLSSIFIAIISLVFGGISDIYANEPTSEYPASMISGAIPVIYVNTENSTPIVDKVNPIPAGLWLDPMGSTEYEPVGSEESPVALTIRGRGNSTWEQPTKPYKLKFDKKTSLFGLPKSKHYALMAHVSESGLVWVANFVGFEIARKLGMPWVPHMIPVELVINGQYEGTYFLSETIKIDSGRVNIFEQEEGETNPELIPYGWLLEIDNYVEEYQHSFMETPDGPWIRFTQKSPEVLSQEQMDWLYPELEKINDLIYSSDLNNPQWTDYIDIKSVVRYFIVREVLHDYDSYHGSFYINKDQGENAKWNFGPLWDCSSFTDQKTSYIAFDPQKPEYATFIG